MSDVLLQADKIAGQDRSRDYGHPKPNHQRIVDFWNAYLKDRLKTLLTAEDAATMMILLKIARQMNQHKADNLVDMAGYVKCLAMIHDANAANRNGINGPAFDDVPTSTD